VILGTISRNERSKAAVQARSVTSKIGAPSRAPLFIGGGGTEHVETGDITILLMQYAAKQARMLGSNRRAEDKAKAA